MKNITLLIILLTTSLGYTQQQQYVFDFEAGSPNGVAANWFTFDNTPVAAEIVDNPDLDGVNATASKVMKVVVGPGNAFYAGVNNKWEDSKFGTWKIDTSVSNNLTLSIDVNKNYVGTVGIKMGTNSGGTSFQITDQNVGNTIVDEWQTLTWNLSGINFNGDLTNISQMVVFVHWTEGKPDREANSTIYIDNIKFNAEKLSDPATTGPTVALPLDFESVTTWVDFNGGVVTTETNPHNNADNNSANVGKMVKNADQPWGGSSIVLSSAMDFATNDTFTMKVYSPRVGAKVLVKVENSGDSGINFEKEVLTTKANAWETLTFDYSAIDKTKSYDKFVTIFDNGTMGDGSANFTFYIDDITLSKSGTTSPTVALPLDFESATTWVDFNGGVVTTETNPYNNADNNSANVGKMVKNADQPWGGSSIVLSSAMDFATNDTFTMKVYSPRVGAKVLVKVENSGDSGINFEKEVLTTKANAWETLTFDYSAIDKTKSYDKFVTIFDNGTMGDGSANFTFYIDDITLSKSGTTSPTVALPLDFESATTWVDFNGGVVTTETNPYNNADNNSANVGKMVKNADQPWGGSSIVLSSAMDFATNDTFTMKVYSPRVGAKVLVKVENSGDSGINFEKEVLTTKANAWETLTFDYSAIDKTKSYDKFVTIFDNGTMGDGSANFTFYIDDITLLNSATASIKDNTLANVSLYPNPATSFVTISAENTIEKLSVFNILGKVVKTISVNNTSKNIDVSDLNSGIYLIKFTVNNSVGTAKFIKR
ncbi:T9SS type A sorting domain-containing protein [Polaribacter cellanae]|uniref:T9SS type A sorting domain-containing protein n=1 Tax=Polaribacter cellanae TaxID=2818493 RepID=A0A975CNA6_9FLAO|nr:T9SS type A sorting domain-containing protein [Polaribacter cellanae]QTE22474.1 T9SS type A sorting domain-containing protein [Polaribacter cellanae]